jgi:hypothetical protein
MRTNTNLCTLNLFYTQESSTLKLQCFQGNKKIDAE